MNDIPTLEQIKKSQGKNKWDIGNKVLYDLCADNFYHEEDDKILAKVWLIGRAYSVAVERMHNKTEKNDDFYINRVAPAIRKSKLDGYLNKLKESKKLTVGTLPLVLEAHNYLTTKLREITYQNNRSFSSKYLHFHLPNLFFIYDSRAETAKAQFVSRVPKNLQNFIQKNNVDEVYAKFFLKCFDLKTGIDGEFNISLSPRQLDNILIEIANSRNNNK